MSDIRSGFPRLLQYSDYIGYAEESVDLDIRLREPVIPWPLKVLGASILALSLVWMGVAVCACILVNVWFK